MATEQDIRPVLEIADSIGLSSDDLDLYGKYKAKVHLDVLDRLADRPQGKYVDVTAITPTPLGEGKTTTSIGLVQALGVLKRNPILAVRQASVGPIFGIKGGAAGGGKSQVVPLEGVSLHLTGDIHALTAAHNLISAAIDSRIMHEDAASDEAWAKSQLPRLNIDPYSITWNRLVDINDRALRNVIIGLGAKGDGRPRTTGYDISAASELMAILGLVSAGPGRKPVRDLRDRIGRIIVGTDRSGKPVTVEDLGVAGAATVMMKDAIMPNLLQTMEGQAAFVHAGPFANIAHGNSSIVSDQIAVRLGDYVVTESGFAADIGMEKFFNIKCRVSGLIPNCVVVVATIRALKMHGGGPRVVPGRPLDRAYTEENLALLEAGGANLAKHISIARAFGVPTVVAINRYDTDTEAEVELVRKIALNAGAEAAASCQHFTKGGPGAVELAEAVIAACEKPSKFDFLYPLDASIKEKIETIATKIYGADGVTYEPKAERQIRQYEQAGFGRLPVCMAKTHLSISHDPKLKNVPTGWTLPIREARAAVGAGFIYPLCGTMSTMPGLPVRPNFLNIDIDDNGEVVGLF